MEEHCSCWLAYAVSNSNEYSNDAKINNPATSLYLLSMSMSSVSARPVAASQRSRCALSQWEIAAGEAQSTHSRDFSSK
eukprot:6212644-Pleurochrysis_carterae.AAC.2